MTKQDKLEICCELLTEKIKAKDWAMARMYIDSLYEMIILLRAHEQEINEDHDCTLKEKGTCRACVLESIYQAKDFT